MAKTAVIKIRLLQSKQAQRCRSQKPKRNRVIREKKTKLYFNGRPKDQTMN